MTVASHFKRNNIALSRFERREAASARAAHETSNTGRGTALRNRRPWPLARAPSPSQSKDRTSRAWGSRCKRGRAHRMWPRTCVSPARVRDSRPTRGEPAPCLLLHMASHCDLRYTMSHGSVTKRLLSSTASKAHGSSSWHGMACACVHRLHLVEDSATARLLVACIHRCSGQGCTATFLLRFLVHSLLGCLQSTLAYGLQ